jgi:hypothetical protein
MFKLLCDIKQYAINIYKKNIKIIMFTLDTW